VFVDCNISLQIRKTNTTEMLGV